jgi:glycosyltransferase involved in cell wall biosynthesis
VRVSIFVDTYNHKRLIEQAINTVLAQGFPLWPGCLRIPEHGDQRFRVIVIAIPG